MQDIFPTIFGLYWFVTTYMVLMLLTPFLNKFIHHIAKEEFKKIIIVLVILWSIIPTFLGISLLEFSNLGWFITLYFIAGYIKLHTNLHTAPTNTPKYIFILILFIILLISSSLIFNLLGNTFNNDSFLDNATHFGKMNSIIVLVIAVLSLLIALNNSFENKIINKISSTTFGIYLIHDNYLLRPFLWVNIIHCYNCITFKQIFITGIISTLAIFTICCIIDFLRQISFEKIYIAVINRLFDKL